MGCNTSSSSRARHKNQQTVEDSSVAVVVQPGKQQERRMTLTQNVVVQNQNKDIRDYYDIDHQPVLGAGISGQVKICIHKATKTQYALKSLSKRTLKKDKLSQLKDEIRCMSQLDHPNILRLHEYFETNDVIFLILELCRGGELLDRLHEQKGHHYSEKVACKFIFTMLNAISYCHANNIVHRDLKLENFLFENEKEDSELKLIDFGLSHYFKPKEMISGAVGTPYYVAPEVLEGNYNAKCDVWSIGVITYMLLSGTPPFYGKADADTLASVKLGRWQFDEHLFRPVSAAAKDFITKCLTRRPTARPSAATALTHKWFQILKNESDNHVSLNIVHQLECYVKRSSLSKICMDVVAHTLLPEQIADLRAQFLKFDITNSGEISMADLRVVLEQHPTFKEEDLNYIFKGVDIENTGRISYHEFVAATVSKQQITEENMKIAFERMSNHQPFITNRDIKELLGNSEEFDVDKLMEEVGLTPQAKIHFSDFKAIMNGGKAAPMVSSPYMTQRKKINFWADGSDSTASTPRTPTQVINKRFQQQIQQQQPPFSPSATSPIAQQFRQPTQSPQVQLKFNMEEKMSNKGINNATFKNNSDSYNASTSSNSEASVVVAEAIDAGTSGSSSSSGLTGFAANHKNMASIAEAVNDDTNTSAAAVADGTLISIKEATENLRQQQQQHHSSKILNSDTNTTLVTASIELLDPPPLVLEQQAMNTSNYSINFNHVPDNNYIAAAVVDTVNNCGGSRRGSTQSTK